MVLYYKHDSQGVNKDIELPIIYNEFGSSNILS